MDAAARGAERGPDVTSPGVRNGPNSRALSFIQVRLNHGRPIHTPFFRPAEHVRVGRETGAAKLVKLDPFVDLLERFEVGPSHGLEPEWSFREIPMIPPRSSLS